MLYQNATIIDGTNRPGFLGHVLVKDDRIDRVFRAGETLPDDVGEILDCTGKWITPGFIDAHSHNDFYAAKPDHMPYFEPFVRQGVTTMVVGNCGFSAAGYPEATPYNDQIGGGLFSNDGQNFGSFSGWVRRIDRHMPVNMIALVGHGTARIGVAGKASAPLSPEALKAMTQAVEQALFEGAAGISFGLMYEPGQFAPASEIETLARIAKKHDKIATFHARAYSKVSTSYNPPVGGRAHNLRAMDEVVSIARATGVKTQYSHLIFVGKRSWGTVAESLRLLEETKASGIDIGFDLYPMEFGASIITVVLPVWYLAMEPALRKRALTRIRLWLEVFIATKALGFGFGDILVTNTYGVMKEIEGLRVTEIAKRWKKSAFQTYLELVDKSGGRINVLMYKYQNPAIIERLRRHPLALYMTDAWIEPESGVQNFAAFYAFPKFLSLSLLHGTPIEEAVHKMTGATAARFGLSDRGTIASGNFADLVVIDPSRLAFTEGRDASPAGIDRVVNNGKVVVKDGVVDQVAIATVGRFLAV
ncbi:MAG: hypothetical protein A2Y16_01835 [Tenericutes bacterium GWF2_57_13]|nr:MAG: hypothetical protein A2Y16_01835 [Tenericutes bacterium GWF2_57_13]